MSVQAGPRRRLEPDARREQILSVAVRLFGERGYAGVSATDVARGAGVARGLVNHYFGTKKDLYLEVIRVMLTVPGMAVAGLPGDDLPSRVDAITTWFLDVVSRHSRSWLAAITAGGMSGDPDVDRVIAQAIDAAAEAVLAAVWRPASPPALQAMARAYVGLAVATAREWLERGVLTRAQVHKLLSASLLTMVEQVFPDA
ncbi:TetR/AcrR family transcriptional regulator [Actinoplanes bogorensis]|uniref:TetR/AcrR family transcriptional regulator n=1 Tax=Paractinoplanes bogorensis TaxID=1610840 RepID=A0ABS5Z0E1_9ACTN|nr:TetR/AcrR family transcriptional regulator [Actinoplanes bogorensis]MBU2669159.1 TetR/AcrR family transcriptional regulator [Actinoplanes bogorensis]